MLNLFILLVISIANGIVYLNLDGQSDKAKGSSLEYSN